MALSGVIVYQFEYFDRATKTTKVSDDFATEAAITGIGAKLLPETAKEVPPGEVTFSGIWRPERSQPRE